VPVFLLPILIWIAMAAGSLVRNDYSVDLSLSFMFGFVLAMVTSVVVRLRRRTARHVLVRLGLAGLAGAIATVVAGAGIWGGPAAFPLILGPSLLVWPWGAPRDAPPGPGQAARSRIAWGLPFLLAPGQTFGAVVGFSLVAGSALERDPVGSALALLVIGAAIVTLVLSLVTVASVGAMRRPPAERLGFRAGMSLLTGALIGGSSWAMQQDALALVSPALLFVATIVLSMPWPSRAKDPAIKP